MTFEALLNSLVVSDTNSLGMVDIVLTMVLPFLLSFPITYVYRQTQRHNNYSTSFVHAIFLFSTLSAVITLLIGSNIARAFGLVGALSIIRFRNALKDPLDAVYIFWALAVGMACGTGFYMAAVFLVAVCAAMVYFLHVSGYGTPRYVDSILKVLTTDEKEATTIPEVEKILKSRTKSNRQVNVFFNSQDASKTYVYSIRTAKAADAGELQAAVGSVAGVTGIHHLNRESSLFAD